MNTTEACLPALGKHLTNTYDPRRSDAQQRHRSSAQDAEGRIAAWRQHLSWVNDRLIGPPLATEARSQSDLEHMGMIGIYARPEASQ